MNLKSPLVIIKCPNHLSIRRALLSGVSAASLLCAGPALAAEVIDSGIIVTVPGDHPSPWNYSGGLTVGKNGSGTLNIVNGGVVSGDGATIGDGSTGMVTVDGAGSTWTTDGVVYIGNADTGTLIISNGGKYNSLNTDSSVYFELGEQATGNGMVVVSGVDSNTGDRSELITNNRMYIGNAGTGRLDVLGGGLVSAEYSSSVGELNGSTGVLNVSGVDAATDQRSTFRVVHNQFWVGDEGEGTVNVTNGGLVQVEQTIGVGWGVDSIGHITVSGVDQASGYHSTIESGQVRIGYGDGGIGTLAISDGGRVSDIDASVGYLAGSKGIAVVEGTGSEWKNVGEFTVGHAGEGELLIRDGGKVSSALGYIGRNAGSAGTVTVEGAGSEWKNVNTLTIGNDGGGELLIRDGGKVSSASGQIGHGTGSNGAVNVEGSDSIWMITNRLNLGELGTGTLNIRNGGQVSAYLGEVGIRGGTGNVLVEGAGSALTIAQTFGVGAGGIGALIIRDGGAVYDEVGTVGLSSSSAHSVAIVDGPGSIWMSTDFQSVGGSGNGTLTVSNGGAVIAPLVYLNLTSEINIGAAAGHAAVAPGSIVADKLSLSYDNNAHLVFNHTDMSGNYAFAPTITGGNANSAVDVYSGNTVLTGVGSDYFMATNIHGGILSAGGDGIFSANSNFTVDTAGTLDLRGYDQTIASLANAGNVNFGGAGGTVLTVAGNYTGNGGRVTINTVLGDDNSKTDLLQVNGDTSGSSKLYVNNVGGKGAQTDNGIKVVEVGGQSKGSFALGNGYTTKDGKQAVVGGAYAYTLQQGGANTPDDGNWYLTSQMMPCDETDSCSSPVTPATRYSAGVPVYEGYLQNMQALNKLPTLQERVGERYWTGRNGDGETNGAAVNDRGVWARIEGAHNRLEPDTSLTRMKQDINTFIMQAGVDGQLYEDEAGKLIAGITGQYGHAKGDISSFHGDGDISTDAWSLGATATWYGNAGFYVDGQAQVTWFDSDLNSSTANQGLADGRKATGYAMSIEAGQRFAINQNWSLTPQAQLMYSSINANAFHDTWGSRVSLHDGDSLIGRVGLAANYANSWKGEDGLTVNSNIYGIANLYQEMLGGSSVNVSGVEFDTDNDKTWAGIGAGGTYAWADNKYALYGEGSINTALNHFSDSYTLKGTLGFKVKW